MGTATTSQVSSLVNTYLKEEDKQLIEKVSRYPVDQLCEEVSDVVLSTERLIFNKDWNKKGLQLVRCVLSFNMNRARQDTRAAKYDASLLATFRRDGCLVLNDVFSEADMFGETLKPNDRYRNILQMTLGDDSVPDYKIMQIQNMPATRPYYDVQTESHFDTFHPTCKSWVYLTDIAMDNAPLHFAKGTHIHDENRLRFMYELSCRLDKIEAGDFRDLNHQFDEPTPILGPRFTTIFADVACFHKRGIGKDGFFRKSARGDVARKNPFRDINV
jgi:hypothetical protein